MFKVEGKTTAQGNYNTQGSCPKGHIVFKKDGDTKSAYKCAYSGCGLDVP